MVIKFIVFDWGGTLGKSGQREIFIKARKNKSLSALQHDTISTLRELRKKGVGMGILSNTRYTREGMHKGLVKSGLKKYFDFEIYSSDDFISCSKPCGDIYAFSWKLIKQLIPNIRKKQVLYVGDNYYADVMGAQNFGYSAAYIVNQNYLQYYLAEMLGNQEYTLFTLTDLLDVV